MTICNKCNKNEVPSSRKSKCHDCARADEASWNARQAGEPQVEGPVPINPEVVKMPATGNEIAKETGTFQSTVWNHSVAANSYEVGKVGDRFKLYFETPADLKAKMQELRDAGLMDLPLAELPRD
ncbi:hypothetical protein LCGC14_0956310 [marine sediment metagenome]|uniref:Uncharacterized protein n=1 Tax=marine sediment metagenome TaxID=412755 RepID=A0A0F9NFP4_9ZZZZ